MTRLAQCDTGDAAPSGPVKALSAGGIAFEAGDKGCAWRVERGVVRLDSIAPDGQTAFASLAIEGDIVGCEAQVAGFYAFRASALTECQLRRWPEDESALNGDSLLRSLATAHRRAADLVALRGGQAVDRVVSLIRLFADRAGKVILPTRRDIADITDLRFETISRIIKGLERSGVLSPVPIDGVRVTRGYLFKLAATGG